LRTATEFFFFKDERVKKKSLAKKKERKGQKKPFHKVNALSLNLTGREQQNNWLSNLW